MENTNISATSPTIQPAAQLALSDSAARKIAMLLADEPAGAVFRISIQGGGCSGFSYIFDLDSKPVADTDLLIEKDGARVAVDDVSIGLLGGSVLDYAETLGSAGFEIKNPNATASCGCGNSFSV